MLPKGGARPAKKPKRQLSEREAKRAKKNEVKPRQEHDKDQISKYRLCQSVPRRGRRADICAGVEHLNYKRLVTGTRVLARVHTVLPLHLILSLPNNLLAHVSITEISNTLTALLSAEEEAMSVSDDGEGSNAGQGGDNDEEEEDDSEKQSAPELSQLFTPGQYFPACVLNAFLTASQSFISQYPVTETTRLAARLEMTLMPEKVNAEVAKADVEKGFAIVGELKGEEDKGWRVGLGLGEDGKDMEGWLSKDDVKKHSPSMLADQTRSAPGMVFTSRVS